MYGVGVTLRTHCRLNCIKDSFLFARKEPLPLPICHVDFGGGKRTLLFFVLSKLQVATIFQLLDRSSYCAVAVDRCFDMLRLAACSNNSKPRSCLVLLGLQFTAVCFYFDKCHSILPILNFTFLSTTSSYIRVSIYIEPKFLSKTFEPFFEIAKVEIFMQLYHVDAAFSGFF